MRLIESVFIVVIIVSSSLYSCYSQQNYDIPDSIEVIEDLYSQANELMYPNLDSANVLYSKCYQYYHENSDTVKTIQCLLALSEVQKIKEDYSKSYDYLWEALSLAESSNNVLHLYLVHVELGMLYSIFEKEDKALLHKTTALKICKKLVADQVIDASYLLSSYFRIALLYRQTEKYDRATCYFDTCQMVNNSIYQGNSDNGFIKAELGYINMMQGDYAGAEVLIGEAIEIFIRNKTRYLIIAYSYMGELKSKQGLTIEAISNFQKCLQTMDSINIHIDLRPKVLEHLAILHFLNNDNRNAYRHLKESKVITDSLFNIKGSHNRLVEMKNKYIEDIELRDKQLKEQELLLVQKTESYLRLKIYISFVIFFIILFTIIAYAYFQKKKYVNEKRESALKVKHDNEKAQAVLKVKNKELASSTLQLIDKDRIVKELFEYIKVNVPRGSDYQRIKNTITSNNQNLWDEFNARFVAVNAGFYENLREKFPTLTPTERKHCALIKLKFSGKEMAQLLRISVDSVHISRHRLRKKMNLSREVNLSDFIAKV